MNNESQTSNFSLYLHIPFCRNLCPFCHFYHVPEVPDWRLYLEALSRELDSITAQAAGPMRTLYAGGGTPTLLPPEFYKAFFSILRERFGPLKLEESTIETDGQVTREELSLFAEAGFNRISLGMKSFNARTRDLLRIGRPQRHDQVADAREAGFSSVGLDIVYGVKGQTLNYLSSDIETALTFDPDHVSLYALEENGEIGPREAGQDPSAAMFRRSMRILRLAGFQHYEITNFSRSGHRSVHNQVYWCDGDYFGLGPSAHSSVTRSGVRTRWRNRPEISAYMEDPLGCREVLSRESGAARAREALILGLRMTGGVERAPFVLRYGLDPVELLRPHYRYLIEQGLLKGGTERVRLTTRGMLLSNEVFVRII